MMSSEYSKKILVIHTGGMRRFIKSLPEMAAIRKKYPAAHITLLTCRAFADLASRSGYVDDIRIDRMPKFYELDLWLAQIYKLAAAKFDQVYDLQDTVRSRTYLRLSGLSGKRRTAPEAEAADISWFRADIGVFDVKPPYVLLAPGSAHAYKRWPAARYGGLVLKLQRAGINTVLIGNDSDRIAMEKIKKLSSGAVDLSGRTSLYDVATLAEGALAAVGGDTAPMHVLALKNIPVVILSADTDSEHDAPKGSKVVIIHADDLSVISLDDVYKNLPVKR